MCSFSLSAPRVVMAAAACSALSVIALPSATAAPAADDQGYVDSTARCAPPNAVVVFGSTDTSRVAICRTPGGQYEYRGVRIRDGAKLIAPASKSGDGEYVADNNGISYTVTANSLIVSSGNQTTREERVVDFTRRNRRRIRRPQRRQRRRRPRPRRRRCHHRCLPRRVAAGESPFFSAPAVAGGERTTVSPTPAPRRRLRWEWFRRPGSHRSAPPRPRRRVPIRARRRRCG